MPQVLSYATQSPTAPLAALSIDWREPGPRDVEIDHPVFAGCVIRTRSYRAASEAARCTR